MVQVQPFYGLRYRGEAARDMAAVTAPPYDVISPDDQAALYARHPYNIVRLILGKAEPTDNEANNVYTRSKETLHQWEATGVMAPDPIPGLYAYSQTWEGTERRGVVGALKLEDYAAGKILPHEHTLGGPKADRLALTQATECLLSPIFCLYDDPTRTLEARIFDASSPETAVTVCDPDGVVHRFWPLTEPGEIQTVQDLLADRAVLIADGHHRYETAMAYAALRREQDNTREIPLGQLPWDFTMAFLTNMADSGLRVYPTHRVLVSWPGSWTPETLQVAMADYFEPVHDDAAALFWLAYGDHPRQAYRLKPSIDLAAIPDVLRALDVAILDYVVFQTLLGMPANQLKQEGHLHFLREKSQVQQALASGAMVFRVHAPDVAQVRDICASGERMPQKSTYFYPKLLSGLVLYPYRYQRHLCPENFTLTSPGHTTPVAM